MGTAASATSTSSAQPASVTLSSRARKICSACTASRDCRPTAGQAQSAREAPVTWDEGRWPQSKRPAYARRPRNWRLKTAFVLRADGSADNRARGARKSSMHRYSYPFIAARSALARELHREMGLHSSSCDAEPTPQNAPRGGTLSRSSRRLDVSHGPVGRRLRQPPDDDYALDAAQIASTAGGAIRLLCNLRGRTSPRPYRPAAGTTQGRPTPREAVAWKNPTPPTARLPFRAAKLQINKDEFPRDLPPRTSLRCVLMPTGVPTWALRARSARLLLGVQLVLDEIATPPPEDPLHFRLELLDLPRGAL